MLIETMLHECTIDTPESFFSLWLISNYKDGIDLSNEMLIPLFRLRSSFEKLLYKLIEKKTKFD